MRTWFFFKKTLLKIEGYSHFLRKPRTPVCKIRPILASLIDLSRFPLQCVWTKAPERGWGGHFNTFAVFLFTLTSIWRHCLLDCGKGLIRLLDQLIVVKSLQRFSQKKLNLLRYFQTTTNREFYLTWNSFHLCLLSGFKKIQAFFLGGM